MTTLLQTFVAVFAIGAAPLAGAATELRGMIHVGSATHNSRSDEFTSGFDKSPYGVAEPSARATVRLDSVFDDFVAGAVTDIDSQRSSVADLHEAWLGWHPIPKGPWRVRTKVGAFFPVSSLEVGYDQIGWTAERTISASAINSWIAEEIRILGAEVTTQWRGALVGSPHEVTGRLAVFGGNDPAGTEIAWRGWHLGNRTTGLFQKLRLPDLPAYRPGGHVPAQSRNVRVFREIDDRPGYYGSLGYAFDSRFEVEAMHYDNRADPLKIEDGQYGWHTRFDHLAMRIHLADDWDLQAQIMRGRTTMGGVAVDARFSSGYLLASRTFGAGTATLRYDYFAIDDLDGVPNDSNKENGFSWAIAWAQPLSDRLLLLIEAQRVRSHRSARALVAESPRQIENILAIELRFPF